jgi:hypothetical protein
MFIRLAFQALRLQCPADAGDNRVNLKRFKQVVGCSLPYDLKSLGVAGKGGAVPGTDQNEQEKSNE